MAWPTTPVNTTGMDADTDTLPRSDILDLTTKFNALIAMRGVDNGVCDLDGGGKVPSARLAAALGALYGLTPAADKGVHFTSASTASVHTLTAFARTLLDDPDAATARATLGTTLAANAGGTADAITATYTPAITALSNGLTVYVRAGAANTTTAPTFSPNGLTAATIVKGNNLPLAVGDIAGAGHWLELQYDTTLAKWVLQNPATGVSTASNGEFRSIQVFTTPGTHTYTRPAGLVRAKITVVGGGGGGGGGGAGGNPGGAGGGGGGAAIRILDAATLGASQTVTVGSGGTAGPVGVNGGTGGTSSFGTLVSATGGAGGAIGGNGGAGGLGASGSLNIGGSGGGSSDFGAAGGSSIFGGGAAGINGNIGSAGRPYGGGGAGSASNVNAAGGAGAAGVVIVEEFF